MEKTTTWRPGTESLRRAWRAYYRFWPHRPGNGPIGRAKLRALENNGHTLVIFFWSSRDFCAIVSKEYGAARLAPAPSRLIPSLIKPHPDNLFCFA